MENDDEVFVHTRRSRRAARRRAVRRRVTLTLPPSCKMARPQTVPPPPLTAVRCVFVGFSRLSVYVVHQPTSPLFTQQQEESSSEEEESSSDEEEAAVKTKTPTTKAPAKAAASSSEVCVL